MDETHAAPARSSEPDVAALLNKATLKLAAGVRSVPVRESRVAVRHDPSRTQIVVTPAQWRILENFAHGTTVPKVLCGLIEAQCCPPLREYYELILKATRSRLLLAAGQGEPDHVAPAKWPVSLKGKIVRWPAVVLILGAIGAVFWRKLPLPADPLWPVLGWLAFCAAASLGSALAASVTRGADQQVHRARLKWKTLFPRFEFDTGDAALAGRAAEADVALARAAIPALVFTLVAWKEPRLMAGFSVGLLWQWAPWLKSPLQDLLAAWLRDPQLATRYDLALAKSRLYSLLGAARNQIEDGKYLGACAVATVAWLGAVFLAGCALWQANARNLLDRFNAAGGWHYTALGFLGVIGLAVTGAAGTLLWFGWEHFSVWRRERAERALRPKEALMSDESRAEWLGKTVLFREMAKEDLLALAQEAKPEEFARGSFVVKEGEQGDRLYIIVSGRLEVRRDYAPGRSEPVAEIGEGEVFGEIALLHGGVRTRSIRALQKSILLSLDKAAFDRLVLGRMTRGAVENAVQKVGFLESCGLTKHWSHATRADFGRKSELKEYEKGRVLIQQGEPNHWFFLIYRGEVDVVKNGKEIRRLKQGEGFGEMSLVGDGIATATIVVAGHTASFLVVQGRDFLDFITRDFTVGMAWDETRKLPREKRR